MSGYLLALSLGPVQGFIAAARRTRDLWFGSHVLAEVSKAAARFLQTSGATLIFPAPDNAQALQPDSELLVANHILAQLPDGVDPSALASGAREAAEQRWRHFAAATREAVGELALVERIWEEQVQDVLEFYAAWVPWQGEAADYVQQRERVEQILAGRKALRDFRPARGCAGVPKSSLDGAHESVLSSAVRSSESLRRKLKVKRQEHLDAVGLVKRCAPLSPGTEFVSVVRVAADSWIRRKHKTAVGRRVLQEIGKLCQRDFAAPVSNGIYSDFPYDATPLYLSRLAVLKRDDDLKACREALTKIEELLLENFGRRDQPTPYFALLLADGDRMGATLSGIKSATMHRDFSRRLSLFARQAGKIVSDHHGCLVYSGGDDVLAFVPVEECLGAARELHDTFAQQLRAATDDFGNSSVPTLSVGIAIGHCFEPLEDLLNAARAAESAAKAGSCPEDERDGLAIHFWARSAGVIGIRDQWNHGVDKRLARWMGLLHDDKLSKRAIYDLQDLADDYRPWPGEVPPELLRHDLARVLQKKETDGQALPADVITLILNEVQNTDSLARLAKEMLVAGHMAAVCGKGGAGV